MDDIEGHNTDGMWMHCGCETRAGQESMRRTAKGGFSSFETSPLGWVRWVVYKNSNGSSNRGASGPLGPPSYPQSHE